VNWWRIPQTTVLGEWTHRRNSLADPTNPIAWQDAVSLAEFLFMASRMSDCTGLKVNEAQRHPRVLFGIARRASENIPRPGAG
jgi:hypothetical protein